MNDAISYRFFLFPSFLFSTYLDGNPVVSHVDIARIHENVLARVGVQSIRVADFSGRQQREIRHGNVLGQKGMQKPKGAVAGRKPIQKNVGRIVEFHQLGPRPRIGDRLVVGIDLLAILREYGHGAVG